MDNFRFRNSALVFGLGLLVWTQLEAFQLVNPLTYDNPQFGWLDNRDPETPRVSPNALVGLQIGSCRVLISYGRPAFKNRSLARFQGSEQVWRTGADEASTITFSADALVEGRRVPAGSYSLFTIPGETESTVILNTDSNLWGTQSYLSEHDLIRFRVRTMRADPVERLSFSFEDIDPDKFSASVVLRWGGWKVSFKVREAD